MIEDRMATLSAMLHASLADYPGLSVHQAGDSALIEGVYDLRHNDVIFDAFLISIEVDAEYPEKLPVCREIGGRVPKTPEYHTNSDGTMCLGVPEDIWFRMNGLFEIKSFIEKCLRPFLIGVACKLKGEPWPFGERRHGAAGIAEYYGERFGTLDESRVLDIIAMMCGPVVRGHWLCPCGSGEVLRRCHRTELLALREGGLPRQLISNSASQMARLVAAKTEGKIAEMRRLAATMERLEKRLKISG